MRPPLQISSIYSLKLKKRRCMARRDVYTCHPQRKTDGEGNCFYYWWPPGSFSQFHLRYGYNFCSWLQTDGHSYLLRLVGVGFHFLKPNNLWQRQPPWDIFQSQRKVRMFRTRADFGGLPRECISTDSGVTGKAKKQWTLQGWEGVN